MTLYDLYLRIIGTTGLDMIDLTSLRACISNCMADLTSRGYKIFKELRLRDLYKETKTYEWVELENPTNRQILTATEFDSTKKYKENDIVKIVTREIPKDSNGNNQKDNKGNDVIIETVKSYLIYSLKDTTYSFERHDNWLKLDLPEDIRKVVYLRLYLNENATVAKRVALTDPRVQCRFKEGIFKSRLDDWEAIYYILNDKLYIEWNTRFGLDLQEVSFGYYQKLYAPEMPIDPDDSDKLRTIELDIRPEFEDALVLYAAYFYTARVLKDSDKINLALSNYKYYVEDIIHELSYEDEFNEEDAVIKLEEDD